MIDEEATFEKFGYYSTNLKPKSHKKIIAVCDDCGKVRILFKHRYYARCLSCALIGERNPLFGKHRSEETKQKMSDNHADVSGENHPNFGKKHSDETKQKMRDSSPHISGEKHSHYGKHPTEETRKKLSDARKGESNPNWQGGKSYEPYCSKFNNEFKEYIREKFGRICFLCPTTEEENGQRLSVHHVNGNKNCGCDDDETCQFVPLCVSCHGKMRSKKVDWEKKIKEMMKNKLNGWFI